MTYNKLVKLIRYAVFQNNESVPNDSVETYEPKAIVKEINKTIFITNRNSIVKLIFLTTVEK